MNGFVDDLALRLADLRRQGLYRELRRIDSPQAPRLRHADAALLNFSSNDYLGLANDPIVKEAAHRAVRDFGAGAGASRLICGSLAPHHELERALAEFHGTAAALTFASGYATALGTIGALLEPDDVIVVDKLVHASVIDAARLSGAKLRVFGHNDLNALEKILKWAVASRAVREPAPAAALTAGPVRRRRVLVVTESVFSMDGDLAPLREIVELKDRYGAWLMLDEAHATGLFGERRRGLAEAFELGGRIEIHLGTLGKALGSAGGYICGPQPLIDWLVNRARSFIFSTAPPPASAAAATAALGLVQSPEGETRRARLWARVDALKNGLVGGPWKLPLVQSAILPLVVGDETRAAALAADLRGRGVFIPAVRFPAVARGTARLRLTVTAAHTAEEVRELVRVLNELPPAG